MSTALTRQAPKQLSVEKACVILAECKRVDEAKDIRDQAIAVATYLRQKKAATTARDDAFEIALRAERRMGELLARTELAKGGRPQKSGKWAKKETGGARRPVTKLSDLGLSKDDSRRAQKLAALPEREFNGRIANARDKAQRLTVKSLLATTAATDHDGDAWMTPEEIASRAQQVLGGIDLDPASTPEANNIIKAKAFYTEAQDGRKRPWKGKVWLNPPFSHPLCGEFVARLVELYEAGDVTQAILIVNAATDVSWFQDLMHRYPVCFTKGRVAFLLPGGKKIKGNMYGQAIFFLGCDWNAVVSQFSDVGVLMEAA